MQVSTQHLTPKYVVSGSALLLRYQTVRTDFALNAQPWLQQLSPTCCISCKSFRFLTLLIALRNRQVNTLAGNPCEVDASQAVDTITTCLRRNRLGLCSSPMNTPSKSCGGFSTPPTTYHTVQPFCSATSPESKDGGSARRVLQTSDKENWAVTTGKHC